MIIGERTLTAAADTIRDLLLIHQREIETSYFDNDDTLSISIGLKFHPGEKGIDIDAAISFVTGKVKDAATIRNIDESQMELPL